MYRYAYVILPIEPRNVLYVLENVVPTRFRCMGGKRKGDQARGGGFILLFIMFDQLFETDLVAMQCRSIAAPNHLFPPSPSLQQLMHNHAIRAVDMLRNALQTVSTTIEKIPHSIGPLPVVNGW